MDMKRVGVFCGSSPGARPEYSQAATQLGRALVRQGIGLVYGGGNVGIMGVIANAVLEAGGEVIGVIPKALATKELAHNGVTDLRVVGSMHDRKALMAELSDGFIALPGGLGTLEEFFEVLTWAQLGMHQKPCGLLNVYQYFTQLISFIDFAIEQRFVKEAHRALILIDENPESLLEKFKTYQAPRLEKWIDQRNI